MGRRRGRGEVGGLLFLGDCEGGGGEIGATAASRKDGDPEGGREQEVAARRHRAHHEGTYAEAGKRVQFSAEGCDRQYPDATPLIHSGVMPCR